MLEPPHRAGPLLSVKAFKPTAKMRALAKAMRETSETTYAGLAKAAGLEPKDLSLIRENEQGIAWVVEQALKAATGRLGEIYLNTAEMAEKSKSPPWVELALRRFDPAYRPVGEKASAGKQVNVQVNNFAGWSHEELRAFVRAKRQRVLGEAPPESSPADGSFDSNILHRWYGSMIHSRQTYAAVPRVQIAITAATSVTNWPLERVIAAIVAETKAYMRGGTVGNVAPRARPRAAAKRTGLARSPFPRSPPYTGERGTAQRARHPASAVHGLA